MISELYRKTGPPRFRKIRFRTIRQHVAQGWQALRLHLYGGSASVSCDKRASPVNFMVQMYKIAQNRGRIRPLGTLRQLKAPG
jgi:hypothetical protein